MQFKIDKSKINLSTFYLKMRKVGFNIWKLNLPRLGPGVPLDTISIYNKGELFRPGQTACPTDPRHAKLLSQARFFEGVHFALLKKKKQ